MHLYLIELLFYAQIRTDGVKLYSLHDFFFQSKHILLSGMIIFWEYTANQPPESHEVVFLMQ